MRISIRFKLFIVIGVILISFVLGLLIVINFFMDDLYTLKYESHLEDTYVEIASDYNDGLNKLEYLRSKDKKVKVFVTIFLKDYSVVASTSPDLQHRKIMPTRIEMGNIGLDRLEVNDYFINRQYEKMLDTDLISLFGRLSENEYILVEKSLIEVKQASEIIESIVVSLIIWWMLIAVVVAYFASRVVTKPIFNMKKAVAAIAELNFDKKLVVKNNDEIGDLGNIINVISEELKSKINQINQQNIELEMKNNKLKQLSETDTLTGLSNRLEIDRAIDREYERAIAHGSTFSVILLDIDHFKKVNDNYGHPVGDQVLISISKILKDMSRRLDVVGRWGGEEFIIVLPDTILDDAVCKADSIRHYIEEFNFDSIGQLTVSVGVSEYQKNIAVNDIIINAAEALYKAKDRGRNRVEVVK